MNNNNESYNSIVKKRGRPKKKIEINESAKISSIDNKKKRGRKKKTDVLINNLLDSISDSNNTTYIVMLDIKHSDLDTTVTDISKPKSDTNIFDDIIKTFEHLIDKKKQLYLNPTGLNKINTDHISDDKINIDLFQNYNNQTTDTSISVPPMIDSDKNKWPSSSQYLCWNCDSQFNTYPIGIPENIEDDIFHCYGNFCSFACAGRYLIEYEHSIYRFEKLSLLNLMYQRTYNLDVNMSINIAHPKQVLHKYGGIMSDQQYRSSNSDKYYNIELYKLPIIPIHYYICNINSEHNTESVNKTKIVL